MKYSIKIFIRRVLGVLFILFLISITYLFIISSELVLDVFDKIALCIFAILPIASIIYTLFLYGDNVVNDDKELLKCYQYKSAWIKLSIVWLIVHYCLLGISVITPAFILLMATHYSSEQLDIFKIVLYSLIGIFSTLLNFITNPYKQAYGYRMAFELLNKVQSMIVNKNKEERETILQTAIEVGEKYITHSTYNTFDIICFEKIILNEK